MLPAAVSFTGAANVGTAFIRALTESVAFAVVPRIAVVDEPAEVPTDNVAAPAERKAVVEFIVPPTIRP